jgi:hypothetical protein
MEYWSVGMLHYSITPVFRIMGSVTARPSRNLGWIP